MGTPPTPSTPAQRLAADRMRLLDEKKREREREHRRLHRSAQEWERELLHAVSEGDIGQISKNLDELPLQVQNGKSALLNGWWAAADKATERALPAAFERLVCFGQRHPEIWAGRAIPSGEFIFWQRMATRGHWEWLVDCQPLMARMWLSRAAANTAFCAQDTPESRRGPLFRAWRDALSKAAPPGHESQFALSVFEAALDITCHEKTSASSAALDSFFFAIPEQSDRDQALRHALLVFSLASNAPETHQFIATQWALAHGARSQAQAVGHALCLAIERDALPERLLDLLLGEPIDWTQCHALGVALAANRPKLAERLLSLGAPADGPCGAGRDSIKLSRIEPLTGAALLFHKSPGAGERWMRLLIQKGANPRGVNPLGDDLLKTLERADLTPSPALDALLALRGLGGLRPGAWELIQRLSARLAGSGDPHARGLAALAAEAFAIHEANGLRKTIAHAASASVVSEEINSTEKSLSSAGEPSRLRSASRRL